MRFQLLLAGSAAAALLWAGQAGAGSPETVCENAKLRAVDTYTSCLIRVLKTSNVQGRDPSEDAIAQCDEGFDRAFEQAEASGACYTAGGAATLREPIKTQVYQTLRNLSNLPTCTTTPGETAVCELDNTTTAVDLSTMVSELSAFGVTADTPFWIQAWGGNGSNGNACCDGGNTGGQGGYAQLTTSLRAFTGAFGTSTMYYYLGFNGTTGANAGGDGGTATLAVLSDLSKNGLNSSDALLIAAGGGGAGGARGVQVCNGDYVNGERGGPGAVAVANLATVIVAGQDGDNFSNSGRSGQGGQIDQGGAPGFGSDFAGGNPTAPTGGAGGMHTAPQVGFSNALLLQLAGAGGQGQGDSEYDAGGGGGGGGYTGGGGGVRAFGDTCWSGAGGGGSSYARALPNSPTCTAAPTTRPSNPTGVTGAIRITFDLGVCN